MVLDVVSEESTITLLPSDAFEDSKGSLNSETTYYYRAYASNSMGVGYGDIKSFRTLDITAPAAPTIFSAAEFTCPNSIEVTSANQFIVTGVAESVSVVEIFMNGVSMGYANADASGKWTLDLSDVTQKDGDYEFQARATDLSYNTGELSALYALEVNTKNSDLDNIPDICDEDADNDGYVDATQAQDKIGYGISPDGDGINDLLVVKEIEGYPNNELSIYSRSGALVFKANSYDNTWDGTNIFTGDNTKLPKGSYFFVLDLKTPGVDVVQGWIYINY